MSDKQSKNNSKKGGLFGGTTGQGLFSNNFVAGAPNAAKPTEGGGLFNFSGAPASKPLFSAQGGNTLSSGFQGFNSGSPKKPDDQAS